MTNLFQQLFRDEAGFILSSELAMVSTIAVMGLVAGLSEATGNVNAELQDVGAAMRHLNQSYSYSTRTAAGSFSDQAAQSDFGL